MDTPSITTVLLLVLREPIAAATIFLPGVQMFFIIE